MRTAEGTKLYQQEWRKKNRDRLLVYEKTKQAKWTKENPEKSKAVQLKSDLKKKGLTVQEFERMLVEQKSCCKICGTHQALLKHRLHIDHCHITQKVRGLLCGNCNHLLGKAKDNISILGKAIEYLKESLT